MVLDHALRYASIPCSPVCNRINPPNPPNHSTDVSPPLQMLVGLCGAELVHPDSVGASQGVLGWVAYLGAANAGERAPHSTAAQQHGRQAARHHDS